MELEHSPRSSNAAVSVLLGQRWREMHATEKSMYVAAARKIKEDFVVSNPDARRGAGRKNKRKLEPTTSPSSKVARNVTPPSLHALALVGSRLNQEPMGNSATDDEPLPPAACHEPPPQTHTAPTSAGPSCAPLSAGSCPGATPWCTYGRSSTYWPSPAASTRPT